LFARSFVRLLGVDLGFVPEHVLTLKVRTLESRYSTVDQQRAFLDDVLSHVATVHGVTAASAIELLPVTRARRSGSVVTANGGTAGSIEAEPRVISAGYFETMSIGLVLGRSFSRSDVSGSPQVAIVNEGLARRLWPDSNPLGQQIRYENEEPRTVIGVVRDVRTYAVDMTPGPQVYIPYSQTWLVPQQLVVRTDGNPTTVISALRWQIRAVDAHASAEDIQPLTEYVASSIAQPRFEAWLLAVFGCCGLVLTIVGMAGVVVYAVSQGRREIGIRIALGASRRNVIGTVMAPSLVAVAIGLSTGVGAALALGQFARAFLFEIQPHDPVTLSGVVAILGTTALVSAWLPARRATRIDPILALRAE
jgi:putative ABC transport system permease protein